MDSQLLSIVIIEWVNDSDSQSENKPAQRSPNEPKEMKIILVMLCAHSSYKDSFEACFVDLGCLRNTIFNSSVGKQQKPLRHGVVLRQFS